MVLHKMSAARKNKVAHTAGSRPPSIYQWAGLSRASTLVLLVFLGLVLVSGLSVVHTTHENRFAFNELQELKDQANQLKVDWGRLLIEQSTFGIEGRIKQKAIEQLQMQVPELANIVMVSYE
ncbi:MAG: cell division protein FtsL [SAR86 cluster bacterium]|uniref:Cell division protein FtsL n=1 Tax=SAR86 cluster bacterium TaxID=2030880 RepID=A0A2A5B0M1_9GAMM|nr:MAG: cell division protein FtsL [SAR86 cluster bacterium]